MTVLLDVLRDGDPHMRQNALDALGPSVENDPRIRKVMTQVMETTKDPDVRQFVSDALGVAPKKTRSTQTATDKTTGNMGDHRLEAKAERRSLWNSNFSKLRRTVRRLRPFW